MAEMVEWPALLKKEGLSKIPFNKVVSTYRSPDEFRSCFANADHLEQYIKGLLTLGEAPLATADDWAFHPMAGTLRPLKLRMRCRNEDFGRWQGLAWGW